MLATPRTLLTRLHCAALLVTLGVGATASDLVAVTASGDVVQFPHPSGTPQSLVVAAGTGGMSTPLGMTYGPDGYLYVASFGTDEVLRFSPNGHVDCGFQWPSIPGFTGPSDLLFDPTDGSLLVSGLTCGRVVRVSVSNGAWSDEFTPYANGLSQPSALSFHPLTGRLLIADYVANTIWDACYTSASIELCAFVSPGSTGMTDPLGLLAPLQMTWRNNELYVISSGSNEVRRYHSGGGFFDVVAPKGSEVPLVTSMAGIAFGPDGLIYLGDASNTRVLKYGVAAAVPGSSYSGVFATGVAPYDLAFHAPAIARFPLPRGSVVATYCSDLVSGMFGAQPDPDGPALIAVDARADGPLGSNWLAPKFWNKDAANPADIWNTANLGPVFAICLDRIGNIYVAATSAYGAFNVGVYPSGPGAVYKIDAATGSISTWLGTIAAPSIPLASTPGLTALPNTGPGLGDITYDPGYDVFFVSNLEDGRIYTVKDTPSGGVVQRAYDPFGNDEVIDGTAGFPVRGERVYAVHSVNSRILLWSGWLRDRDPANQGTPWPSTLPTIWPPLPSGESANNTIFRSAVWQEPMTGQPIIGPLGIWKVMPYLAPGLDYSNPVTDITDNAISSGPSAFPTRILVGERTYNGDVGSLQDGSSAHQARVREYTFASGFPPSGTLFLVGDEAFAPNIWNCAGGVAYEADDDVWSTGDALLLRPTGGPWCHLVYGLERIPSFGNAVSPETSPCNLIDLDEYTEYYNKSQTGDVEYVDFAFNFWGDLGNICSGDVWGSCPCSNTGESGRGCANSVSAAGALLFATGTLSVSADTTVLHAESMPNGTVLFFQGTSVLGSGLGTPFGDGVRCVGGSVIRLATKANVAGSSIYPGPGESPVSVAGFITPGSYRTYQVWYRNAAAFCTPSTFNLTNGIGGTWMP